MAYKEVTDLNADTTISMGGVNKKTGKANPTKIEGYYLGKRSVEDRKSKSGQSHIYVLRTSKGNVGVWGKTDLNNKMAQVVPGHMICITQTTKVPTPNGEMYKFSVQFDPDNKIEVAGAVSESFNGGNDNEAATEDNDEDSYGNSYETNKTYSDDSDLDEEEEVNYNAHRSTEQLAASKAKVQDILNKGKRK